MEATCSAVGVVCIEPWIYFGSLEISRELSGPGVPNTAGKEAPVVNLENLGPKCSEY